jgi:hypothetical protein
VELAAVQQQVQALEQQLAAVQQGNNLVTAHAFPDRGIRHLPEAEQLQRAQDAEAAYQSQFDGMT